MVDMNLNLKMAVGKGVNTIKKKNIFNRTMRVLFKEIHLISIPDSLRDLPLAFREVK